MSGKQSEDLRFSGFQSCVWFPKVKLGQTVSLPQFFYACYIGAISGRLQRIIRNRCPQGAEVGQPWLSRRTREAIVRSLEPARAGNYFIEVKKLFYEVIRRVLASGNYFIEAKKSFYEVIRRATGGFEPSIPQIAYLKSHSSDVPASNKSGDVPFRFP